MHWSAVRILDWTDDFNDKDWHINKISKPILLVRCSNTVGCGCGPSCFESVILFLFNKLLIQPALTKSLDQMELAEQENTVPLLLCNHEARQDMTTRVHNLVHDIGSSPTMNTMSKIMNCAGIVNCLHNHLGLLKLGMQQGVASEIVKEPVFIVSFPRTATTILHRTMAHDRERFRNFDLCDMMSPLPPVARQDIEGRRALAEKVQKGMLDEMDIIFPGYRECLETMHGFRVDEAEEDLGWYDTGLGHMYMDFLMLLYPEFGAKTRWSVFSGEQRMRSISLCLAGHGHEDLPAQG